MTNRAPTPGAGRRVRRESLRVGAGAGIPASPLGCSETVGESGSQQVRPKEQRHVLRAPGAPAAHLALLDPGDPRLWAPQVRRGLPGVCRHRREAAARSPAGRGAARGLWGCAAAGGGRRAGPTSGAGVGGQRFRRRWCPRRGCGQSPHSPGRREPRGAGSVADPQPRPTPRSRGSARSVRPGPPPHSAVPELRVPCGGRRGGRERPGPRPRAAAREGEGRVCGAPAPPPTLRSPPPPRARARSALLPAPPSPPSARSSPSSPPPPPSSAPGQRGGGGGSSRSSPGCGSRRRRGAPSPVPGRGGGMWGLAGGRLFGIFSAPVLVAVVCCAQR